MHLATHFFVSWVGANTVPLERRDRALATLAGIIPDVDAAGILVDLVRPVKNDPYHWYAAYHHVLSHNLAAAVAVSVVCFLISVKRWKTALLAGMLFHLHLLADLLGSGGAKGNNWPVHYRYPFRHEFIIEWQGQWALNAWPNVLITAAAIAATVYLSVQRGYTPVEMISVRADQAVVDALRKRWPWRNTH